MTTIHDAYTNALLADAAYVNDLTDNMTGVALATALTGRMTPALASYIGSNFTVLTSAAGFSSSFEATVWKENSTGNVYVSMRGTQGPVDDFADLDLATSGLAHGQLVDMVNWWLRVATPAFSGDGSPVFVPQIGQVFGTFARVDDAQATGELAMPVSERSSP